MEKIIGNQTVAITDRNKISLLAKRAQKHKGKRIKKDINIQMLAQKNRKIIHVKIYSTYI